MKYEDKKANLKEKVQDNKSDIIYGLLAMSVFVFVAFADKPEQKPAKDQIQIEKQISNIQQQNTINYNNTIQKIR